MNVQLNGVKNVGKDIKKIFQKNIYNKKGDIKMKKKIINKKYMSSLENGGEFLTEKEKIRIKNELIINGLIKLKKTLNEKS